MEERADKILREGLDAGAVEICFCDMDNWRRFISMAKALGVVRDE